MLIFYFGTNLDILDLVLESPHMLLKLLLLGMPFAWLALSLGLAFFAGYSAGKTKKGYKHTFVQYLGGFLVAQVFIGGLLSQTSMAEEIETKLSRNIQFFETINHKKQRLWANPEMGMIGGRITEIKDDQWLIIAQKDEQWTIQLSEDTHIPSGEDFEVGKHIRAHGEVEDAKSRLFEAKRIIPMKGRMREFRERLQKDFGHLPEGKRKTVRKKLQKHRSGLIREAFQHMTPEQQNAAKDRIIDEGPQVMREIIDSLPEATKHAIKQKGHRTAKRIIEESAGK